MDPKRFTRRLIALGAAMFLCALVFVVTLFDAQIVNGDDYLDKSIPLGQIESCNYVVQVMCGAFRL